MLPAISADLPVYLVPPKARSDDLPERAESGFGPDTRVDIRRRGSEAANSGGTTAGVYGPDGQFVEASEQRTARQPDRPQDEPPPARPEAGRSEADRRSFLSPDRSRPSRSLALSEFDIAVPPADHEELRDLADRVNRFARVHTPKQFERIGRLMDRVGRFDEAHRARVAAQQRQETAAEEDATDTPADVRSDSRETETEVSAD